MILYRYFKWKKILCSHNEKSLIFFAFYLINNYNYYVLYFSLKSIMKNLKNIISVSLLTIDSMLFVLPLDVYGQQAVDGQSTNQQSNNSIFNQNPVSVLDSFYTESNRNNSDIVQNTDLDWVTSNYCNELAVDGRFSITKTLCNIKLHIGDYLQYVMYIWLSAATILLIRNGFKLVTSSDRDKQMTAFKKNFIYIVIWVVLLISFYYIIDIFVSFVNLVAE